MFRHATQTDCPAIHRLASELEQEELDPAIFARIFKEQLARPDMACLVCEEEGEVVAFINLRFEWQLHHCERICEIMEFIVSAGHRDEGLGTRLFAEACLKAKQEGCAQIEVASNVLRQDAHRFYERQGMRRSHFRFSMCLEENQASGKAPVR